MTSAEFVGQLIAAKAMTSFQRARGIVETGMDYATIARTRAHANFRKGFENEDIGPAGRERASYRAPDDAAADDHYVGLVHGLEYIRRLLVKLRMEPVL